MRGPPLIKSQTGPNPVKLQWPFREDTLSCEVCGNLGTCEGFSPNLVVSTALKSDCSGCAVLKTTLESFGAPVDPNLRFYLTNYGEWLLHVYDTSPRRDLILSRSDQNTQNDGFPLSSFPGSPSDTDSSAPLTWLRQQVADCRSIKHEACRLLHESLPPYLPSRVLEVTGPTEVRLYVSTQNERNHYICLSHCWGRKQLITTTKATLATHQQRIPWEALPKTFKEAIEATHSLGLKFIWIDSLCIVQDDLDDWRREGSKMGAIYRSSYLTVAAASSHDSSGGLFATSPPECSPQKIIFEDSESNIFVQAKDSPCHSQYTPPAHKMKRLPLLSRAWTFQEMLLAPRVALFAADEIVWLCPSLKSCECSSALDNIFDKSPFLTISTNSGPNRALQWRSTVEQYTRRYMTFEKDIFPALSGLANLFASQGESNQYLAGVWENSLVEDLLWCNRNGSDFDDWRPSGRPSVWRAPTWSWASIKGIVIWNRNHDFNWVARAKASVELAGIDAFGELESATLWLTAPYVEVHLMEEQQAPESGRNLSSLVALLDSSPDRNARFRHGSLKHVYQDYQYGVGGRPVVGSDTIHLALMATEYGKKANSFWCMVLLCADIERQIYERIGLVDVWEENQRNDLGPFNDAPERTFTVV